ncbi:MAG: hypothetical protein OEW00_04660 [candidate division Zixibacteria bacterium]|nr:hypothetical protein [candidate division Zixibacteria bacterium]
MTVCLATTGLYWQPLPVGETCALVLVARVLAGRAGGVAVMLFARVISPFWKVRLEKRQG